MYCEPITLSVVQLASSPCGRELSPLRLCNCLSHLQLGSAGKRLGGCRRTMECTHLPYGAPHEQLQLWVSPVHGTQHP